METLRYVVLANGLLAIVSIGFYVLLRRETFFGANRLALWLGLTASLVLPLVELPDWRPKPVQTFMQRTAQVIVPKVLPSPPPSQPDVTITFPNGRTYPAFPLRSVETGWSWLNGLIGLYAVVLILLLGRFGVRLRSLMQLIRQSAKERYDDFTLVRNNGVTSPFSFFGWVVLNPNYHAPDELEQILRHERVHVRAWHSVDMVGAELVSIVFWFNPAAHVFRRLVHQTLEFSADRTVLAEGVDAGAYQYNLVKVSLSADQSSLTNHFSKSQLKSRIVMLNKQESSRAAWLKYSVLLVAMLTVAVAFARHKVHTLAKSMPAQAAAAEISTEPINMPAQEIAVVPMQEQSKAVSAQTPTVNAVISADTTLQPTAATTPDSAQKSPSRYIQYEGDRLYWIITPKTSFDDLAIMKREFERRGYKMQIQGLKYDPLYSYITDIKITIIRPTAGTSDFEDTGVEGKPIRSHGGFNGLIKSKNVAAVGSYPFDTDFLQVPQELVQIIRDDELSVAKFIQDNRMKYLVATGRKISNKYAPSSSTYNVDVLLSRPDLIRKYGIKLNADSTIDISNVQLPVFVDNETVTNEVLRLINTQKLSTLIVSEEYGKNGQPGAVNALLFYTKKP